MSKNRFYMYTEYIHFLEGMEPTDQALLFRVILQYEGGLEIEEMTPAVKAVFSMIKNRLDNNREEYEKACEIHRECGKKGGRPKTKKTKNNQNKPNETKPNQTKPDNDNDKDNDKEIDINTYVRDDLQKIVDRWNRLSDVGIAQVRDFTDKRKTQLQARVKNHTADHIMLAIERIRGSDFLCGRKTDWKVTFDWFIKPGNITKILEGNYDNKGVKVNGNGAIEGWGQDYDPYRKYRTAGDDPGGGTIFD